MNAFGRIACCFGLSNAPPSHDDHEKAATTTIQKNNYKSELDKLEKEELGK